MSLVKYHNTSKDYKPGHHNNTPLKLYQSIKTNYANIIDINNWLLPNNTLGAIICATPILPTNINHLLNSHYAVTYDTSESPFSTIISNDIITLSENKYNYIIDLLYHYVHTYAKYNSKLIDVLHHSYLTITNSKIISYPSYDIIIVPDTSVLLIYFNKYNTIIYINNTNFAIMNDKHTIFQIHNKCVKLFNNGDWYSNKFDIRTKTFTYTEHINNKFSKIDIRDCIPEPIFMFDIYNEITEANSVVLFDNNNNTIISWLIDKEMSPAFGNTLVNRRFIHDYYADVKTTTYGCAYSLTNSLTNSLISNEAAILYKINEPVGVLCNISLDNTTVTKKFVAYIDKNIMCFGDYILQIDAADNILKIYYSDTPNIRVKRALVKNSEPYYKFKIATPLIADEYNVRIYNEIIIEFSEHHIVSLPLFNRVTKVSIGKGVQYTRLSQDSTQVTLDGETVYEKTDGETKINLIGAGKNVVRHETGYKLAMLENGKQCIVKLYIPEYATRVRPIDDHLFKSGIKDRCNVAIVMEIQAYSPEIIRLDKRIAYSCVYNKNNFAYIVGTEVTPDKWDDNPDKTCTHGIHYFTNRDDVFSIYDDSKRKPRDKVLENVMMENLLE